MRAVRLLVRAIITCGDWDADDGGLLRAEDGAYYILEDTSVNSCSSLLTSADITCRIEQQR